MTEVMLLVAKDQHGPLICSMTADNISEGSIDIYADTDLYTTNLGSPLLFIVFGSLQTSENFQFIRAMPVGSC